MLLIRILLTILRNLLISPVGKILPLVTNLDLVAIATKSPAKMLLVHNVTKYLLVQHIWSNMSHEFMLTTKHTNVTYVQWDFTIFLMSKDTAQDLTRKNWILIRRSKAKRILKFVKTIIILRKLLSPIKILNLLYQIQILIPNLFMPWRVVMNLLLKIPWKCTEIPNKTILIPVPDVVRVETYIQILAKWSGITIQFILITVLFNVNFVPEHLIRRVIWKSI